MINLPNFPTDNLYKFIAISGIVLFIFAIVYPEYRRTELNKDITLNNGEIKKLLVENNKAKSKLEEIKEEIDILDSNANITGSFVNDSIIRRTRILRGENNLVEDSKKIDKLVNEWSDLKIQIELKAIEINIKSELIKNNENDIKIINEMMNTLGPISVLITFFGFLFWYSKTQRLQDKMLLEQTSKVIENEICQSCGMFLYDQQNFDLFSENQKNIIYCNTCYSDNKFKEPELTLNEMKLKVKNRCKEMGADKITTFILVNKLYKLKRWRKKLFTWK